MHQNVTDLSPEQNQAIELLISGKNPCNIAEELGIHRQTLWRWRQLPVFQSAYRECLAVRRESMHDTVDTIIEKSLQAVLREANMLDRGMCKLDRAATILKLFRSVPLRAPREEPIKTVESSDH